MRELAKKRLQQNFQQSAKYLSLVFNDFFVLALIFIFGAVMFWYAQVMKVLPAKLWYYPLLLSALLWLAFLPGKMVTLLQAADRQFLLATDDRLGDYLAPMRRYSLVLPALLLALAGGIMYPFASLKMGLGNLNYFSLILALFFAKAFEQGAVSRSFTFDHRVKQLAWLVRFAVLALLLAGLYLLPNALYLLLAASVLALLALRAWKNSAFDWQYAIDYEAKRKETVYAGFAMFTDVKERQVTVKRRKYLDFLLPPFGKESPNSFLYRRTLLRDPEYLSLLARMTAFAILLMAMIQDPVWSLVLSALVMYLTVWQLLPLGQKYDQNIMYRVYPIGQKDRGTELSRVLSWALLLQAGMIIIFWLAIMPGKFAWSLLLLVCCGLLAKVYLPHKTQQLAKKARYKSKKRRK
ncbi:ABC transporter permease [Lactobacillus nasalidis]|uniref:ABC transporter permease n=1 Tax=Lactobacillus nasalidis TaxID=2797258 RepID=A0ABQ3WCT8_9LACO|nr:ABC transporter permease [Lactobacillus nasalidis]GHV96983.1 ABC transporter permease [Lactobacillus nasalidis]GHV99007.1 ABC transporter permease [Lactobacillus nasalidis]GHW02032.1 ABC transporter permease [Lactobacillus nasalidis]